MNSNSVLIVSSDPAESLRALAFGASTAHLVRHQFERGADCIEALSHYERLQNTVVIVDSRIDDIPSLNVVNAIHLGYPRLGIVVVLEEATPDCIQRAMLAGAQGAVLRNCSAEELQTAAERVSASLNISAEGLSQRIRHANEVSEKEGVIIGIVGAHGGSGKTSTFLSLAHVFGAKNLRVLALDLSAESGDSIFAIPSVASCSPHEASVLLQEFDYSDIQYQIEPSVYALRVAEAELTLPSSAHSYTRIAKQAAAVFDVVLLNTGAYSHVMHSELVNASDFTVCMFNQTTPGVRAAKHLLELLRVAEIPQSKYRCVANCFSADGLTISDLASALDEAAISVIPKLVSRAIFQLDNAPRGEFITKKNSYSAAIIDIAEHIALACGIPMRSDKDVQIKKTLFKRSKVAV